MRLPDDPTPSYNLGFISYYDRGNPAQALTYFTRAWQMAPHAPDHQLYMAMTHLRLGHVPEARQFLNRLQEQGGGEGLLYRLSEIALLHKAGSEQQAQEQLSQLMKTLPQELQSQVREELSILLQKPASAAEQRN